jgi:putative PIN family toxin of toxin-antitoxin system
VKVILDTNVFVSGVFFSGPPNQILKAWQDDKIELIISPDILDEYRRVGEILAEEHPGVDLFPVLEFVIQTATIYSAPPLPDAVCEDPDDDKFFACALASGSTIIVSGDKHLLEASGYRGIEVVKPRDFVNKHLG